MWQLVNKEAGILSPSDQKIELKAEIGIITNRQM
jgi:hypothetical protein